jgi:hypothetical protein
MSNRALKNLSYDELTLWEDELTIREEELKRRESLPAVCSNSTVLPVITDEDQEEMGITIAQKTLIENASVNEFILRDVLVPLIEEARNDIRDYRLLSDRDKHEKKYILQPSKFGVRTILELIDSMEKCLDKRDQYVTLLPDMKKEATIQTRIQDHAREALEGKIVSFHRNSLPDTVYKGSSSDDNSVRAQKQKDRKKVEDQMKQMEEIEKAKNQGQMLF